MSGKTQEERNAIVREKMLDLRDVEIVSMPSDSPWLRPIRMKFSNDGVVKSWDLMRSHSGVCILIFNTSRKKLVFVRQFRAAAYLTDLPEILGPIDTKTYPADLGLTLELCAGIIDKDKPVVEIARDELMEECGYEAPASAFTEVISYRNVSKTISKTTLYYVEVTDEMHVHPGGGAESEGELIEVVEMSVQEMRDYLGKKEAHSPGSFLFALYWFLANKPEHCS